jgi:hypothetical protein
LRKREFEKKRRREEEKKRRREEEIDVKDILAIFARFAAA